MTTKDFIIKEIERSMNDLFRSARAMSNEQLNLKVGESCRSALELLQECAQSLKWPSGLLAGGGASSFTPEAFQKAMEERASWKTAADCEQAARENWKETIEFIRGYDEADLDREIDLPFAPDLRLSVAAILASPAWNMNYHLGQINFIQTTYGDMAMH